MPSDAFPVIKAQFLPMPGTCAKCGSSQRDCIDLLIDHDYYGAVMLCILCAKELVNVDELGFMFKSEAETIKKQNDALSDSFITLSAARVELNARINRLLSDFDTIVDTTADFKYLRVPDSDKSQQDLLPGFARAE